MGRSRRRRAHPLCVYDRTGRGRSDSAAAAQDGDRIATDLHTLLECAGVTDPLVLIGHSIGGLYVLDYAARYPGQVAEMVLLDGTPPTPFSSLPDCPASTTCSPPQRVCSPA
jgi:pimeloyl-ACP methyl ester carboxylesterase